MEEKSTVNLSHGGVGVTTGLAIAAILNWTGVVDLNNGPTPRVETVLEAKEIAAHMDTIAPVLDTVGKVIEPEKIIAAPRKVEFPVITVPSSGWFVFNVDNYKPVTVVITQGEVIIKKVIDPGIDFVREAGGVGTVVGINTVPLNGIKTRGVDSLTNEDL